MAFFTAPFARASIAATRMRSLMGGREVRKEQGQLLPLPESALTYTDSLYGTPVGRTADPSGWISDTGPAGALAAQHLVELEQRDLRPPARHLPLDKFGKASRLETSSITYVRSSDTTIHRCSPHEPSLAFHRRSSGM
jgi:hypothetical protein